MAKPVSQSSSARQWTAGYGAHSGTSLSGEKAFLASYGQSPVLFDELPAVLRPTSDSQRRHREATRLENGQGLTDLAPDDRPQANTERFRVSHAAGRSRPASRLICKTRTPTVSGEVRLGADERLSVVIDGVVYGPNQGLVIRAGVWSVTIPKEHSLDAGLYTVTALVCDASGRVTQEIRNAELEVDLDEAIGPLIYSVEGPSQDEAPKAPLLTFTHNAGQCVVPQIEGMGRFDPFAPFYSNYPGFGVLGSSLYVDGQGLKGRSSGYRAVGKKGLSTMVAVASALSVSTAHTQGLPTGGAITAGSGQIDVAGSTMTITQSTAKMAADWQTFNIGVNNKVQFVQPNAQSVALNRVVGSDVSRIQGALSANGQVFLINPNGIVFTPTAQVDVGGLVASTLNITNENFLAGNYQFEGNSTGSVVNQGSITTQGAGSVALIAAKVEQLGQIQADQGDVILAAGSKVRLDVGGPVKVEIEEGALNAAIEQGGGIRTADGKIYLTAKAAGDLTASAINHTGILDATSLTGQGGDIRLEADAITLKAGSHIDASGATGGGTVLVGGEWQGSGSMRQATTVTMEQGASIDASATNNGNGGTVVLWSEGSTRFAGSVNAKGGLDSGDGGAVEVSGKVNLGFVGSVNVSAPQGHSGLVLLDPTNVTITDSGTSTGTSADWANASNTASYTINKSSLEALAGNVQVIASGELVFQGQSGGFTLNTSASADNLVFTANKIVVKTPTVVISKKDQIYNGAVELQANLTATSNAGDIGFIKTVQGPHDLVVNVAADKKAVFNAEVGGSGQPLNSVTTSATGNTYINANITTTSLQTYLNDVWVGTAGVAQFQNSSFEDPLISGAAAGTEIPGWTYSNSQVTMGSTMIGGFKTPIDTTYPTRVQSGCNKATGTGCDGQGSSSFRYTTTITAQSAVPAEDGTKSLQMRSDGTSPSFGIVRGPYIISNGTVPLTGGDSVEFKWRAQGGNDAYDVYGYLLNTATGGTVPILNATGADARASTPWTTAKVTLDSGIAAGTYKFVFVMGTWDATGGRVLGAQLFVDSVKASGPPNPLFSGSPCIVCTVTGSTVDMTGANVKLGGHLVVVPQAASTISSVISGTNQLSLNGPGTLSLTAANTYTGATTSNIGTLVFNNATLPATPSFLGTGKLAFEGFGTGSISTASLNIANTLTGLRVGPVNATTGTLNLARATTINGPIELYGANVNITQPLTSNSAATDSRIMISAHTAATQTAALSTGKLLLAGNGTFTLENTSNTIGTLAGANALASISVNGAGKLSVGSISIPGGATYDGLSIAGDALLTATATATSLGDVEVNAPIIKATGATTQTLTIRAANTIVINDPITATSGPLHVSLNADYDRDASGITILSDSVTSNGGNITFGLGQNALTGSYLVGGDTYIASSSALSITSGGGNILFNGEVIVANPSGLTLDSRVTGGTTGGNITVKGLLSSGNVYEAVPFTGPTNTWVNAREQAKAGTTGGSAVGQKFLATVNSRLVNSVAAYVGGYRGAWLGGFRDKANALGGGTSTWYWVGGTQANQAFFTQSGAGGAGINGQYSNFGTGEPNGQGVTGESALQFFGTQAKWNDLQEALAPAVSGQYSVLQYIRETNLADSPITVRAGTNGSVTLEGAAGQTKTLGAVDIEGGIVSTQTLKGSGAVRVFSSGDINIGTSSVTSVVSTTSSTADHLVLTAGGSGVTNLAGTAAGGDVKLLGTVQFAAGVTGVGKIYTDSVTGSTGLSPALGLGKFRYYSDPITSNFTAGLTGPGTYAIYRERPTVTVAPQITNKVYDGQLSAFNSSHLVATGLVNGDLIGNAVSGSATGYTPSPAGGINVGTYTIAQSTPNYTSPLGYNVVAGSGTMTIVPAVLTVTADNKSRFYGDTNPVLTQTISGFVNGEGLGVISGSATPTTSAVQGSNVGTYSITAFTSGMTATNYTFTPVNGTLTVNKRPIAITINPYSKTFDSADPSPPSPAYSITSGSVYSTQTIELSRASGENVGTYPITPIATSLINANYEITVSGANFTINRKPVLVQIDAKSKVYGDPDPVFSYVATGLRTNDVIVLSRAAGESANQTYQITATEANNPNYRFNEPGFVLVPNNLSITPRPVSLVGASLVKTYGDSDPALTYTIVGDSPTSGLKFANGVVGTPARGGTENAGVHTIALSGLSNPNFTVTSRTDGTLTINKRSLSAVAEGKSRVYGDANPALTYSISGFAFGETDSVVSGSAALTTSANQQSNVGSYPINIFTNGLSAANYSFNGIGSSLQVERRPVTITVDAVAKAKTYGDLDPDPMQNLNFASGNLVNGDSLSLARNPGESIGNYNISGAGALNPNYAVTITNPEFQINKRVITFEILPGEKLYGEADPLVDYRITSGGGAAASAQRLVFARDPGENVDVYAVRATTAGNENYAFDVNVNPSTLTIRPRPVIVTIDEKTKVYGDTDPALTYTVSPSPATASPLPMTNSAGLIGSDSLGSLNRASGQNVNRYTISAAALNNPNYTFTVANPTAALTVTPRPITVAFDNLAKTYGDQNPPFTYSLSPGSSLVGNDTLRLNVSGSANVGSYIINANAADNPNYMITATLGTFRVNPRPITIRPSGLSKLYGDFDPAFSYQVSSALGEDNRGLVAGDDITNGLYRPTGEGIGSYPILFNASANPNYQVSIEPSDLVILPRPIDTSPTQRLGGGSNSSDRIAQSTQVSPRFDSLSSPRGFDVNGGLALIEVALSQGPGMALAPSASGSVPGASTTESSATRQETPGRVQLPESKLLGYTTVFVVNGGIALPPQTDFLGE